VALDATRTACLADQAGHELVADAVRVSVRGAIGADHRGSATLMAKPGDPTVTCRASIRTISSS
jgi:hypothetical protein